MWYVMQVMSRQEGRTVRMLEQSLSREILTRCLIPMRRRKKKFHGQWQEVTEMLFPGYVFLVTDTPQLLYDELKNVPALTKLLGSCEEPFTPLSEPDVQFLMKLQGDKDIGETGLSQVAVGEGRQVRIQKTEVELDTLLLSAYEKFEPLAQKKSISINGLPSLRRSSWGTGRCSIWGLRS